METEAEFIEAAKRGNATKISSLLKADPGLVRAVGDHLKTALHWAAEMDRLRWLLHSLRRGRTSRLGHHGVRRPLTGRQRWGVPAWPTCYSPEVPLASR